MCMEMIPSLHPNPYLLQPRYSGFTVPALGKSSKPPSRMGNIEGMWREVSEAVPAAGALRGNHHPPMGRQLSETSATLVLQKHKAKNLLSSLVQDGFGNLLCNNTFQDIRTCLLQRKELQKNEADS